MKYLPMERLTSERCHHEIMHPYISFPLGVNRPVATAQQPTQSSPSLRVTCLTGDVLTQVTGSDVVHATVGAALIMAFVCGFFVVGHLRGAWSIRPWRLALGAAAGVVAGALVGVLLSAFG